MKTRWLITDQETLEENSVLALTLSFYLSLPLSSCYSLRVFYVRLLTREKKKWEDESEFFLHNLRGLWFKKPWLVSEREILRTIMYQIKFSYVLLLFLLLFFLSVYSSYLHRRTPCSTNFLSSLSPFFFFFRSSSFPSQILFQRKCYKSVKGRFFRPSLSFWKQFHIVSSTIMWLTEGREGGKEEGKKKERRELRKKKRRKWFTRKSVRKRRPYMWLVTTWCDFFFFIFFL